MPIQTRKPLPAAPVVQIVERGGDPDATGIVVPNDVLINGVSVLCSDDDIVIHEIGVGSHDAVRVTLTLLARRVIIGHESEATA